MSSRGDSIACLTSQLSGERLRKTKRSQLILNHRPLPTINTDTTARPLLSKLEAFAVTPGRVELWLVFIDTIIVLRRNISDLAYWHQEPQVKQIQSK
jgi:hypothetical protein